MQVKQNIEEHKTITSRSNLFCIKAPIYFTGFQFSQEYWKTLKLKEALTRNWF